MAETGVRAGSFRGRRTVVFQALAIAGAFCVLIGLGTWQLQRMEWKQALIAAANDRPSLPPVPAPGPDAWPIDFADWDYRRVALSGTFGADEAHAWIHLSEPNGRFGGEGYFLLAPFTTDDGWHVIVNRGFVPAGQKEASRRPQSVPPEGRVTIEGLVRQDDPPNFVTPAPDLAANQWFSRDIAALSEHFGLPSERVAPFNLDLVADQTPQGGLPQAGESRMAFSNNHLQYALTWYGVAAALLGVTIAAVRKRSKSRQTAESSELD